LQCPVIESRKSKGVPGQIFAPASVFGDRRLRRIVIPAALLLVSAAWVLAERDSIDSWLTLVAVAVGAGSATLIGTQIVSWRRSLAGRNRRRMTAGLAVAVAIIATIVVAVAVGIFVFVTTPEVAGRAASRSSQAVQAASVCAAVIGGAITLWLSNIRRDHDRSQLALERRRLDDQRFAQAVSMVKEEGDTARIGAIEMLRDLATLERDRTQAVLDVLGAVIRVPAAARVRTRVARPPARSRNNIVQEAALRTLRELLPPADGADGTVYTVDLSGASLGNVDFRDLRLRIC